MSKTLEISDAEVDSLYESLYVAATCWKSLISYHINWIARLLLLEYIRTCALLLEKNCLGEIS